MDNSEFKDRLEAAIRTINNGSVRRVDFTSEFDTQEAQVTVELTLHHPGCELIDVYLSIKK